jgi:hypothetical protein
MSKDSHPFSGVSEGAFEDFSHEKYNKIIWLVAQFGGYTAHQFLSTQIRQPHWMSFF